MDGYLVKPITTQELDKVLASHVARRKALHPSPATSVGLTVQTTRPQGELVPLSWHSRYSIWAQGSSG